MAHEWESKDFAPGTKYFQYFGSHDIRECKKCGAIQVKDADYLWGRVVGYSWSPKVGRCKGKLNKNKQLEDN